MYFDLAARAESDSADPDSGRRIRSDICAHLFFSDHHQPLGFERTLISLENQIGDRALWLYQAVAPPSTG
jgi:hypothetical protein